MPNAVEPLVFDGHNDVLSSLFKEGGLAACESFLDTRRGHINLKKARQGGFGGGFFAVYLSSPSDPLERLAEMQKDAYDVPLPPPIDWEDALPRTMQQVSALHRLEKLGALRICTSAAQVRACLEDHVMAAILHIEGAEAIDPEFATLDVLYAAGLRSLGPVWSRPTLYGHGVPFRFPSTGDTGPGLTPEGIELVHECNRRGIMIDLSHLNEAGFWDVAKHSDKPLVATHSNAYTLCHSSRNLTDKQLAAIAESDGMVGVNYAVAFLREDGRKIADTPLDTMLRHIDHIMGIVGEDRIGLGSDYDGAMIPDALGDAAGLPALREALRAHGFDEPLLKKLCHDNWLRTIEIAIG